MTTQATIPADWIAHELGLRAHVVIEWATRLGLELRRDDSGREWLAESDGHRIIEEIRRAGREAAELRQAYETYLDDWQQQQRQAGEDVFQRVLAEEHLRQLSAPVPASFAFYGGREQLAPGPQVRRLANAKAEEARREFERKHPRMDLETFEKKWRKGKHR